MVGAKQIRGKTKGFRDAPGTLDGGVRGIRTLEPQSATNTLAGCPYRPLRHDSFYVIALHRSNSNLPYHPGWTQVIEPRFVFPRTPYGRCIRAVDARSETPISLLKSVSMLGMQKCIGKQSLPDTLLSKMSKVYQEATLSDTIPRIRRARGANARRSRRVVARRAAAPAAAPSWALWGRSSGCAAARRGIQPEAPGRLRVRGIRRVRCARGARQGEHLARRCWQGRGPTSSAWPAPAGQVAERWSYPPD